MNNNYTLLDDFGDLTGLKKLKIVEVPEQGAHNSLASAKWEVPKSPEQEEVKYVSFLKQGEVKTVPEQEEVKYISCLKQEEVKTVPA